MNPPLPLPVLIPLLVGAIAFALFMGWRGSRDAEFPWRVTLLVVRGLALLGVAAIAFNPGRWISPVRTEDRPWVVLRDVSGSMAFSEGGTPRNVTAAVQEGVIRRSAEKAGVPVVVRPYDASLLPALPKDGVPAATGKGTDVLAAVSQALREADATGALPAGVIVLGDGRQTAPSSGEAFDSAVMRARSRNVPVDTVLIGDAAAPPDLGLTCGPRLVTAFPGEPMRLPFRIVSTGLGPVRSEVVLKDFSGAVVARKTVDVAPGSTLSGWFDLTAPQASTRMSLSIPLAHGEVRLKNNSAEVGVRIITSKTRVFLAEGAPYWDSKFLAQLLRAQKHMNVKSVHRITDTRYFRVDSDSEKPGETDRAVFPETAAELAQYDLVVFGKNVDAFLTPSRLEALRSYVRDAGGAVLFARGRATGSDIPALAALEPVVWGSGTTTEFRFTPTAEGEASGLFGEALPSASASLWTALPALKDARDIAEVKPFTRVLAEGSAGTGPKFPALLVRRNGRGVCGLVNGDGLWRWDFWPEARGLGNAYEDFWIQLSRWMASYSEFLPGHDWSVRLSAAQGAPGEPVSVTLAYRGREADPKPRITVTTPGAATHALVPAPVTDEGGRRVWKTSFTPDSPGARTFTIAGAGVLAPETPYFVAAAPNENDDLSPDAAFFEKLSAATGGKAMTPAGLPAFLQERLHAAAPVAAGGAAVWRPSWAVAPVALIVAALFAAEWWLRRRRGLA